MKTLIRNADVVVTMDGARRELAGASVLVEDGAIAALGPGLTAPGAEVIDASGCVVTPGLVNTHHHLYQSLTRAVPGGQDALLFGWLKTLYPIWARYRPEDMHLSTQLGLAELALSGCTMSSDHLYLYPNGSRLDDTIHAARALGLRFHATRGAMSIGESKGGLPPDSLVEDEVAILKDSIRVIDAYSGALVSTFHGHERPVETLSFHPQGWLLASGSRDGTIGMWNIDRGLGHGRIEASHQPILAVGFHPGGNHLVAGGLDKIIRVWRIGAG